MAHRVSANTTNGTASGKRIGGMHLYRLRRGMTLNRALRRAVARAEEPQSSAWEAQVSGALKRRLGAQRIRCRSGRAVGKIWDAELAAVAASGIGATGNVRRVAATLGIGRQTLYRRRQRDADFAQEWDAQLAARYDRLELSILDRMTDGWEEEVWYRGEVVGKRRRFDHSGAAAMLRLRHQIVSEREERAACAAEAERAELAAAAAAELAAQQSQTQDEYDANGVRHYDRRERDLLQLQLMNRHRNRHPEEWEGDEHKESGFDIAALHQRIYGSQPHDDDW